jgi:hypothetical protein
MGVGVYVPRFDAALVALFVGLGDARFAVAFALLAGFRAGARFFMARNLQ